MNQFTYPKQLYPFESRWVTIDQNKIHYIDEGKGEIILFCHPPITSSFMYRNIIKVLSKRFRCIALDFPGFGLSEIQPTGNYVQSINSQSEIVAGFIEILQLNTVYFLMQECGGHAAMKIFMRQPPKLKGIILTDTIIFPVSAYPRIKRMLGFVNGGFFNFFNTNFNFLVRAMTRFGINNRKLSAEERNTYKAMFASKERRRTITYMLHQLLMEEKLLQQIHSAFETTFNQTPTLIIYGEKDPLTALMVPQRIHSLLPNSALHFIKDEGHFPHEGAPGEMNALIENWFDNRS